MIALVVAAIIYMGHKAPIRDISIRYRLDNRLDKLESGILECFKLIREDMEKIRD
jgi:putative component of toxin-antitoxin plasmid stabilization module